jgi:type IV pilus assembly protein PilV
MLVRGMNQITKAAQGFSLLEVLVALLIFLLGFLGVAALQVSSLKFNTSAYHRTQATILAYDILDRMRANRASANALNYRTASSAPASNYTTNCQGLSANCSPAQLASHDLREWKDALEASLPNGQGSISDDPASGFGVLHHVTVSWIDNREIDAPTSGADDRVVSVTVHGEL